MKTNVRTKSAKSPDFSTERLAGGAGQLAAVQSSEAKLRRLVMASLLGEQNFYSSGSQNAEQIAELVPLIQPDTVAAIAREARNDQKLRHTPLFLAREMARHPTHRKLLGKLLPDIIQRADEMAEFVAMYYKDGRQPLAKQVKVGLAAAFGKFNEYQLAKYNRPGTVTLKDVLFLTHAKPRATFNDEMIIVPPVDRKDYKRGAVARHANALTGKVAADELATPDTWEVALSTGADKKDTWERLIDLGRLGALAFMRNLRNMEQAKVDPAVIRQGFKNLNAQWLLPLNYLAAAKHAPWWEREIETLMLRGFAQSPKLPGRTVIVVDVSGSMQQSVSSRSEYSRMDACAAMAMLASEMCEAPVLYATAGSDWTREHQTQRLAPRRGFAIIEEIKNAYPEMGGGGIFTRQCLEYIKGQEREPVDRIIVLSDSADCDHYNKKVPKPFGKTNYIVDVSPEGIGVNYASSGWTAEVSGWSEHFIRFIMALEGVTVEVDETQ